MGWARVDDGYLGHPKIIEVGPHAELLDLRSIIWCAKYETDGLVTKSALQSIGRGIPKVPARVLALIEVGRWTVNETGGWWVHDFLKYNPSKAQKESQRESGRERVRNYRSNAVTPPVTNASRSKGRGGESLELDAAKIVDLPKTEPPWVAQGMTRAEWIDAGRQESG